MPSYQGRKPASGGARKVLPKPPVVPPGAAPGDGYSIPKASPGVNRGPVVPAQPDPNRPQPGDGQTAPPNPGRPVPQPRKRPGRP